jgi:hypothetical protein
MCNKFSEALEEGYIIRESSMEKGDSYRIRGKPDLREDGGEFLDDLTPEVEITHCPFCGDKLRTGVENDN